MTALTHQPVKLTCRGRRPDRLPEQLTERLVDAAVSKDARRLARICDRAGLPVEAAARLLAQPRLTIGRLIGELLADNEPDLAARLDRAARAAWCREHLGRDKCGQDLTELIAGLEPDGEERVLVCPTCGVEIRVTPPLAE